MRSVSKHLENQGRRAAGTDSEVPEHEIKLPRVVYPGGLTPREHAIKNAREWQCEVAAANTPTPSREYAIIVDLLAALNVTDEDLEAIRTARDR